MRCPWGGYSMYSGCHHKRGFEILKITLAFATFYTQVGVKESAGVLWRWSLLSMKHLPSVVLKCGCNKFVVCFLENWGCGQLGSTVVTMVFQCWLPFIPPPLFFFFFTKIRYFHLSCWAHEQAGLLVWQWWKVTNSIYSSTVLRYIFEEVVLFTTHWQLYLLVTLLCF